MWTGFHVGLNAGGTWGNSNQINSGVAPLYAANGYPHEVADETQTYLLGFSAASQSHTGGGGGLSGFIGGGQIGYDYQIAAFGGKIVTGLEADIQGVASSGGNNQSSNAVWLFPNGPAGPEYNVGFNSSSRSLQYLGTVRGRLGYLLMPELLVYGTGGFAYGGVTMNVNTTVINNVYFSDGHLPASWGNVSYANTQTGWTAGGGVEWMFMPNWSAKAEYLYYDLGTASANYSMIAPDTYSGLSAIYLGNANTRFNGNIVRAGVNYHFNFASAPVVAKY